MRVLAGLLMLALAACGGGMPPYERAMQASVYLDAGNAEVGAPHGTGVIISKSAVLTNAHVAKNMVKDGAATFLRGERVPAKVMWISETNDVALLAVDVPESYVPARIVCTHPALGERLVAIGNPTIVRWNVVWGRVSAPEVKYGKLAEYGSIPVDMAIGPGNSGSPVFNENGSLVGLLHGQLLQPAGMMSVSFFGLGLMIPMDRVCPQLGM